MAALPEEGTGREEEEKQEKQEKGEEEDEDTLSLGAEAVLHVVVDNKEEEQSRPTRTSATSLVSSCCSRESLLQSREPDPEQVLIPLLNHTPFSLPGAFGPWLRWTRLCHLDPTAISCCTLKSPWRLC